MDIHGGRLAGCWVESDFTKKHQKEIREKLVAPRVPPYKALAAMVGRQRFASRKKDDVMRRMQCRATQGLTESHFHDWDYILYFDKSIGKVLQSLSTAARRSASGGSQTMAKLVHLTGVEWNNCLLMQDTIDAVQTSLRTWLKKEIGWTPLPRECRADSGPWRTKEYSVPEDDFKTLFGVENSKVEMIEAKIGCKIKFTDLHALRQDRLISFIGPTDSLSLLPVNSKGLLSFPFND